SMKGGMALLHGFSPHLLSMEKSMDLYLRSRETNPFFKQQSLPFFPQPALAGASAGGNKISAQSSGPSLENIVFAEGRESSGSKTPAGFPTPGEVGQEVGKLHQAWSDKGGVIHIEGKNVKPSEVSVDELQEAIWQQRRP